MKSLCWTGLGAFCGRGVGGGDVLDKVLEYYLGLMV